MSQSLVVLLSDLRLRSLAMKQQTAFTESW